MNVLLINGSPHKKGCIYTALSEVAGQLEKNGSARISCTPARSPFGAVSRAALAGKPGCACLTTIRSTSAQGS